MTREWKVGDRALLPVVVEKDNPDHPWAGFVRLALPGGATTWAESVDLIPDDRRPDWLPGQPGDVAEWGGERWMRGMDSWWRGGVVVLGYYAEDEDVPADAVLVLPAKTRGQS